MVKTLPILLIFIFSGICNGKERPFDSVSYQNRMHRYSRIINFYALENDLDTLTAQALFCYENPNLNAKAVVKSLKNGKIKYYVGLGCLETKFSDIKRNQNPVRNIRICLYYLSYLTKRHGNILGGLAAYNLGPAGLIKFRKKTGRKFNQYPFKVLEFAAAIQEFTNR